MATSPAMGFKDILISEGVAALAESGDAWTIKVGRLVESPDKMIATFDTPGRNPNPKWLVDYPTAQVIVRGPIDRYDLGWAKMKDVKDALLGRDPEVIDGDSWDAITGMGDAMFLKYDDKNRPLFSMNFRLIIEPASSALTKREDL